MADPFYWTTSDALAHTIELPPGTPGFSLNAISANGSVIVGSYYDPTVTYVIPAKWTSGALTTLPLPVGVIGANPSLVSDDGSIIAGTAQDGTAPIMWTGGGASVVALPLAPTAETTFGNTVDAIDRTYGDVIAGTYVDTGTNARVACYWESGGAPVDLPNSRPNSSAFIHAMSGDASYVFGHTFSTDGNEDHIPLYWSPLDAYTEHLLDTGAYTGGEPVDCTNGVSVATFIPSNGIAGPFPGLNERFWWNSIDTASGGKYGTLHQFGLLAGFSTIDVGFKGSLGATGGSAVGAAYNSNGIDNVGVVWYSGVAQQLPVPGTVMSPMAALFVGGASVNIIGGYATSLDASHQYAGFWNTLDSGAWTTLQIPDGYSDTSGQGISPNGAVIYGSATPADTPPPPADFPLPEGIIRVLLPPAELQFCDADGNPFAGGTLEFYQLDSSTPKDTWNSPLGGDDHLNTNPLTLDSAGRALIYGDGAYRTVLRDADGNLIWDQPSFTYVSAAMMPVVGAPDLASAREAMGVTEAIEAEATARAAADSAEATARAAADATLTADLAAEVARAEAAEAALGARIDGLPPPASPGNVQSGQAALDASGYCHITFGTPFATSCDSVVITGAAVGVWSGAFNVANQSTTGVDVWGSIFGSRTPAAHVTFFYMATGH